MLIVFPARRAVTESGMAAVRFAMIAQVRAYWEALREGGALPQRARIDPRGIEGALANSFLIERIAPGIARFRLAGMHLTDIMGMDVRGMPFSSLFEPADRDAVAPRVERVFATPCILDLCVDAGRGVGRPAFSGRMILLPVKGEGGADLALGCLATEGIIGRSPRRLSCGRALEERILTGTPTPGFAEEPAPFVPRGRPHLRLVRDDE